MAFDLRITGPLLKVLHEFLQRPGMSMSGADIARRANLKSGTLYPLLSRLEEAGLLLSKWENVSPQEVGRPRRRLYEMTGLGVRQAKEAFREVQAPSGVPAWSL